MAEIQSLQQWSASEPYLETHCSLGEGPYYEPGTNTLRFVDIIKQRLHTVSLTEGPSSLKTLQFSEAITVTADIEGRDPQASLLVGAKQGLAVLDRKTGQYEYVTKFEDEKGDRIRSNDGVVDPNGRFWLGTMTDFNRGPFQPEGEFPVSIMLFGGWGFAVWPLLVVFSSYGVSSVTYVASCQVSTQVKGHSHITWGRTHAWLW